MRSRFFNPLYSMLIVGVVSLCALAAFFYLSGLRERSAGQDVFIYCAAGMRYPMEKIAADYEKEFGVRINFTYAGSNTLLNQIQTGDKGDLYLAADESYIELARDEGLVSEKLFVAKIRPVIAVSRDNETIRSVKDLADSRYRVAMGNPKAAAVGKKARKLLTKSGDWKAIEANVNKVGVFKPTVNEVANDIKLKVVDAGIVWDSTVAQYAELKAIRVPEFDAGESLISFGVLNCSKQPTAALHFARYATARDRGLKTFAEFGFDALDGDEWADVPKLTFYAGSVNRRAIEDVIQQFQAREGVEINTVYNGCGILTADMRSIREGQEGAFPDVYMACDKYYLETVQEMFQPGREVSSADIVIVVKKGNPQKITGLKDLNRQGVRVALGQPEQCTIGVLSRRLMQDAGVYDAVVKENVVTQTATSALLVPTITTGSADATLAYVTDTLKSSEQIDVVRIESPLAKAIQPFTISNASKQKQLANRLYEAISQARDAFELAGFTWELGDAPPESKPSPMPKNDDSAKGNSTEVKKPVGKGQPSAAQNQPAELR